MIRFLLKAQYQRWSDRYASILGERATRLFDYPSVFLCELLCKALPYSELDATLIVKAAQQANDVILRQLQDPNKSLRDIWKTGAEACLNAIMDLVEPQIMKGLNEWANIIKEEEENSKPEIAIVK